MPTPLVIGTDPLDDKTPIKIDPDGLLYHTLIFGQSGSGKSFLIARLLEEILLHTRARILIVDPNGDFRRIFSPSGIWNNDDFKPTFSTLLKQLPSGFDEEQKFKDTWSMLRFIILNPGLASPIDTKNVLQRRLLVHWDSLDDDLQRFLLNPDPLKEPKIKLGLEAIEEHARNEEQNAIDGPIAGVDLRVLERITRGFALRNVNLSRYEAAKTLTVDDWYAAGARISEVISGYRIWWSREDPVAERPLGISDFIDAAFGENLASEAHWNALILSLDAMSQADTLLTVEVTLSRLWEGAKRALRSISDQFTAQETASDKRVPTFIVIDEAHNFAPASFSDPLRNRVTSRLMQIAAEGRKFGLYLILATQRPTKLHKEIVPECENSCVLRVQSDLELKFLCDNLGYDKDQTNPIKRFPTGRALFNGRWIPGQQKPIEAKIAPARTIVGGTGLRHEWKEAPETLPEPMKAIPKFIEQTLKASESAMPLASLAKKLRDEYALDTWLGYPSLRELLRAPEVKGNIKGLVLDMQPPGFAYLEKIHSKPEPISISNGDDKIKDEKLGIREIVRPLHSIVPVPLLSSTEYNFVLRAISNEVQQTKFNWTLVSKAVRDRCRRENVDVDRSEIDFILRGIMRTGHRFDPDLPQEPKVLAEAWCSSVIRGLRLKDSPLLGGASERLLCEYLSGGLIVDAAGGGSEPSSEPPIAP
jgi:Helicase HerA, central domain/Zonular occludens toxin (Zot)